MTTYFFFSKMAMLASLICLGVTLLAPYTAAQEALSPNKKPSMSSALDEHTDLAVLVEALAQRYQVRILLDPDMEEPVEIAMPEKNVPLMTALNQVTRQMKNATWQCVYLKQNEDLPSPEKLAAVIRMISSLPQTELLVENPPKQRSTLLLSLPRSRKSDAQTANDLLDTKTVYLLYNTALPTDGKTASERMADMQQQQLKLMAQLPLEQRPNPAQIGLRVMQSLDATGPEAALHVVGETSMAAWQNTAPDARDEMIQQFMKTVQSNPPLTPDARANPETSATAPQNYVHTLRDIADTLAKRYRVRILIDPDLYVPTPPTHPSGEITLAQALDILTKSVPSSSWRSVYQKPPTAVSASLSARSLASVSRKLEHMPRIFLHFEIPASQRIMTLQTNFPPMSLQAKLTAHSFAARPTYILYATQDEAESFLPVAQRLEQMQIRQMEQLLSLSSSQMTQVMTDVLDQYSGGTGNSQSQMMRLPIMALLMGTWLPQKAKEDSASAPPPF